jgi:hypothetical protein
MVMAMVAILTGLDMTVGDSQILLQRNVMESWMA